MGNLTAERKGQIAYAYILERLKEEGLRKIKGSDLKRRIGNEVQKKAFRDAKITDQEALEFVFGLTEEVIMDFRAEFEKTRC